MRQSFALWIESVHIAWLTLRANRMRSMLTALTIALGAGTMALLLSLASAAMNTIMTGVDAVGGRDILFVEPKDDSGPDGRPSLPLTRDDVESLRGRVPGLQAVDYLMSMRNEPLLAEGKKLDVDVAIGASYPFFLTQELAEGALLSDDDARRVVVLTEPIAKELFGSPGSAVGRTVVLWRERYTVVGVTRDKAAMGFNMGGVSRSRTVFVSAKVAMAVEGIDPRGFAVIRDDGTTDHDLMMDVAASILAFRHGGRRDVEFFDMRAFLRSFDQVFAGIRVLVGLIAAVSLVIAGAGVMNVMLASIRQRIGEIGIRRAVGASAKDIRRQFLVEASMVAAFGGVVGTMVGMGLAFAAGMVVHAQTPAWSASPQPFAGLAGLVAAGAAGVLFGLRPANKAASLWVLACLRGEGFG
jgi:putative ABC transport system permease protein